MKQFKKGIATIAVIALLVVALVPTALAAEAPGEPATQTASFLRGYFGSPDNNPAVNPSVEDPVALSGGPDAYFTIGAILEDSDGNRIDANGATVSFDCSSVEPADNSSAILTQPNDGEEPTQSIEYVYDTSTTQQLPQARMHFDETKLTFDDNDTATFVVTCTLTPPEGASYAAPAPMTFTLRIANKGAVEIAPENATIVTGDSLKLDAKVLMVSDPALAWSAEGIELTSSDQTSAVVTGTAAVADAKVTAKEENSPQHEATALISVTELKGSPDSAIEAQAGTAVPDLTPAWTNGAPTYYQNEALAPESLTYTWAAEGDNVPASVTQALQAVNGSSSNEPAPASGLIFPDAGSYTLTYTVTSGDATLGTLSFPITVTPAPDPTQEPTVSPEPSQEPTQEPTASPEPSQEPTQEPTVSPEPSQEPTQEPTASPEPSQEPTQEPTASPEPSEQPTQPVPSINPPTAPTTVPTVPTETDTPAPPVIVPTQPTGPQPELELTTNAKSDDVGMTEKTMGKDLATGTAPIDETDDWFVSYDGTHIEIIDKDGDQAAPESPLATGMTIELVRNRDNAVLDEATVIVEGDVLGTGKVNLPQLVRMAKDLIGKNPLDEPYLTAGDLDGDGKISIVDMVKESRLILDGMDDAPAAPASSTPAPIASEMDCIYVPQGQDLISAVQEKANFADTADSRIEVVDAQGNAVPASQPIATGMKVRVIGTIDGRLLHEATIIVEGDVLGTGIINLPQLVGMAKDLTGTKPLDTIHTQAGDLNQDGRITINDIVEGAHRLTAPSAN